MMNYSIPAGVAPEAPSTARPELIDQLRADLLAADYSYGGLAQLLDKDSIAALDAESIIPAQLQIQRLLETSTPAEQESLGAESEGAEPGAARAVMSALWLVPLPVSAAQLERAFPELGIGGLVELGLIAATEETGCYRPLSDLRPYQVQAETAVDLWVISDLNSHAVQGPLPYEHVLGAGQASLTLAGCIDRRPVARALDIGTGCGIQVLHLLGHAEHVTATDISQRALQFTEFNLLLNAERLGIPHQELAQRVSLRQGSMLEPVAGESFDLIVSNPPFVITPRSPLAAQAPVSGQDDSDQPLEQSRYTYRDGGEVGDAVVADLLRSIPDYLNPAGRAQFLGNWEITAQDPRWEARITNWAQGNPCHLWCVQRDQQTPTQYATTWLADASQQRSQAEYRQAFQDYLVDFADREVIAVGFGIITLARPSLEHAAPAHDAAPAQPGNPVHPGNPVQPGNPAQLSPKLAPLRRFEELTAAMQQPMGHVIGVTMDRAIQVITDEQAAVAQLLVVPESVTEERHQHFGDEHPQIIMARDGAGFRRGVAISSAAAGFLAACDGEYRADELIQAVCTVTDSDIPALRAEISELYISGFLQPG